MSRRAGLYEKYTKSDIFNLSQTPEHSNATTKHFSRNNQPVLNDFDNISNTIDVNKTATNTKKYKIKYHQSDIFNLNNKSFQTAKKPTIQKIRGAPNISTCFDSMKDNEQFANDIKEYTSKYRGVKTEYNADKYLINENATERLYNQLYDKKRNPIVNNSNKDKLNLSPDANTNKENKEKNLFIERKKNMRNQFTKTYFDQRNMNDKIKLEHETEQAEKSHKYYKKKGLTYLDNDNNNHMGENKYVIPDKYIGHSSKINKQIQLQSNIFSNDEKDKNGKNFDEINERIKSINEENQEKKSKNIFKKKNIMKSRNLENDRNIWGSVHSKWEKSNLDWRNSETELIFGKTYSGKMPEMEDKNFEEKNDNPFQKKMEQLQDSGNKDTINESIKLKRKYNKNIYKDRLNCTADLEKIDEILDEIPENIMKNDKKKKIISNCNTAGLNGETVVDDKFINYNKYHKNILKKKEKKEPTIKIMSNDGEKNMQKRKTVDKNLNNLKNHDDYNIHDFVLSYDSKAKNSQNNFDKFSENEIRLLFSKKGIHVYDIQKNQFDNGKYNMIKFKVRENEGENSLKEKLKDIEKDFSEKKYKICIEKDVEKEKKKNLRNVVNTPGSKVAMFVNNNEGKSNLKKKDPLQIKNNSKFSGQFNQINHKYKQNNN